MTRTRNSTFHGTSPLDADVDVEAFKRVLKEHAQDYHLLYDKVTGENGVGSPDIVVHSGETNRGALLGIPLVNQGGLGLANRIFMADADLGSHGGDILFWGAPVRMPEGETLLKVVVDAFGELGFNAVLMDSTGAFVQDPQLMSYDEDGGTHHAFLQVSPATSTVYYLLLTLNIDDNMGSWAWRGTRAYFDRKRETPRPDDPAQQGVIFPVTSPAVGASLDSDVFHDEYFTDNYAVPGGIMTRFNRVLTSLWEYITGSPVPGNSSLVHDDSAADDPADSRFWAHTRQDFANEGIVEFPLFTEGLGAVQLVSSKGVDFIVDSASPPTAGLTQWFAPFPRDTSNVCTLRQARLFCPDFDDSSSDLKCTALFARKGGTGTPTQWQFRVNNTTTGTATGWQTVSQIGTTDFYTATVTGVPFAADGRQIFQFQMQRLAAGFTFGEIAMVGYTLGWSR